MVGNVQKCFKTQKQILCPYPCIDNTILGTNPTNALYMLTSLYSHFNL